MENYERYKHYLDQYDFCAKFVYSEDSKAEFFDLITSAFSFLADMYVDHAIGLIDFQLCVTRLFKLLVEKIK